MPARTALIFLSGGIPKHDRSAEEHIGFWNLVASLQPNKDPGDDLGDGFGVLGRGGQRWGSEGTEALAVMRGNAQVVIGSRSDAEPEPLGGG